MFELSILCLLFLALTLLGEGMDKPRLRLVSKPLASLAFVGAGLSLNMTEEPYGVALLVALLFSLAGDVFLLPKGSKPLFLAGLGSFLFAHIAFVLCFLLTGAMQWDLVAMLSLPFVAVAVGIARWLLPSVSQAMKTPVVAYIAVITAMVILAWSCDVGWLAPAAATLFFCSDISVAVDRFRSGGFLNRLWGLPAYYVAQLLFILWFSGYSPASHS
jgi:uncharacterized membrane protein YhhN